MPSWSINRHLLRHFKYYTHLFIDMQISVPEIVNQQGCVNASIYAGVGNGLANRTNGWTIIYKDLAPRVRLFT